MGYSVESQDLKSKHSFDVIIIGGGAIGSAIAYLLSAYDIEIAVIEKEPDAACGTSGRNSAVVHAGFNNRVGSLMAKLCVKGNKEFENLAKTLDVPYKKTGKLVVGYNNEDKEIIKRLIDVGEKNGCVGLRLIGKDEIQSLEPQISAQWAMLSPNTAIINPFTYNIHLAEAAVKNGITYLLNHEVDSIENNNGSFTIYTKGGHFTCKVLINAAGLFSDKISAMAGDDRYKIYPCRGEYYLLDKIPCDFLKRPVYPVPRPGVGGLGVHLTPTTDGNLLIGPSAEYIKEREDVATTAQVLKQLEFEAKELMPTLDMSMVIGAYAGIRTKLVAKGEENYGDFIIEESPLVKNLIHLIGIESPGLTASMPIAKMVLDIVQSRIQLRKKADFVEGYKGIISFNELTDTEKSKFIKENPDYGEVICRCETVTKAQIKAAIENPLGAKSIRSIKNRVRSTMGRCNGGYCLPHIIRILHDEYGMDYQDICLRHAGDLPYPGCLKIARNYNFHRKTGICVHLSEENLPTQDIMTKAYFDIVIIGAGPAGLSAAKRACEKGAKRILLLERNAQAGGILQQCIHDGFGLERFSESLTGPEYAYRFFSVLDNPSVTFMPNAMVLQINPDLTVKYSDADGLHEVLAGAVILAVGCRERTRGAIKIAGTRPAGVFTAGVVQRLINIDNVNVGTRAVILGSGDVGLIMARRLTLEGVKVECVLEKLPYCSGLARNVRQCLDEFGIPLYLSETVIEIIGEQHLTAVKSAKVDENGEVIEGTEKIIPCDTLVLSVGLIPENELAKACGIILDPKIGGAKVNSYYMTSVKGIFSCGNGLHVHDLVDKVSTEAEKAADGAMLFLEKPQKVCEDTGYITNLVTDGNVKAKNYDETFILCTSCPKGCLLKPVTKNGKIEIIGASCPRGIEFGLSELKNPKRFLTTTIRLNGGNYPLVSIRSAKPVPRDDIAPLVNKLRDIELSMPLKCGETKILAGVEMIITGYAF
ncbi:MAG: FAD-dependent oxidoreductase [Lachnospiraceae bacterium]|jgi:glycerol-3-phosphate dehydrogenase|nr:FAD-dependent oxidoreductase [Lachnospiraceae bacterium]